MIVLEIIAALVVSLGILKIVQEAIKRRYLKFVERNSTALETLNEINRRFVFSSFDPVSLTDDYDNEWNFESVSCKDYLIYRLNEPPIQNKIVRQIQEIAQNKRRYAAYHEEVAAISSFGEFKISPAKMKEARLNAFERKLFQSRIQTPPDDFLCLVYLYRRSMSGRCYDIKSGQFREWDIKEILKRLRNKNGTFFNDREIWNALCRVERGKVSNKMRFAVYERDGYRCKYCGRSGNVAYLEVDHIFPISKGGKSTFNNLQTLCHECNVRKSNQV